MLKRILAYCETLRYSRLIAHGLALAVLFELITIILRFRFLLESTRDTATTIGVLTLGLRVHHGYIGLLLFPLAWCFPLGLRHALWIIAIGLLVSDLIHHFIVLWYFFGSPQFDFIYPDHPYWRAP